MIKNGKLFGKINLFDAAIILLIVVLIIAGITKFKTFNETVDASEMGTILYTVTIYNVRDYTADAFVSGDIVFDTGTDINIGRIKSVEKKPAKTLSSLTDGKVRVLENEYRCDVTLTIETTGTVTDAGYFANKSIELKVGSEKNIETLYAITYGKITSINYIENI